MSYKTISISAEDQSLFKRVEASAAQEGEWQNPGFWVSQHIWAVCSANDIEEAYAYALSVDNPDPGGDEGVITDQMILSAVQYLMHPPAPEPPPEVQPT